MTASPQQLDIINSLDSTISLRSALTGREFTYRIRRTIHGLHSVDLLVDLSDSMILGHIAIDSYYYDPQSMLAADSLAAQAFAFWWSCPSHPQIEVTLWRNLQDA